MGMVLRSIYGKKPENRRDMPKATQQTSTGARVQSQATWLKATPADSALDICYVC